MGRPSNRELRANTSNAGSRSGTSSREPAKTHGGRRAQLRDEPPQLGLQRARADEHEADVGTSSRTQPSARSSVAWSFLAVRLPTVPTTGSSAPRPSRAGRRVGPRRGDRARGRLDAVEHDVDRHPAT